MQKQKLAQIQINQPNNKIDKVCSMFKDEHLLVYADIRMNSDAYSPNCVCKRLHAMSQQLNAMQADCQTNYLRFHLVWL
jgi:hypothetical protein